MTLTQALRKKRLSRKKQVSSLFAKFKFAISSNREESGLKLFFGLALEIWKEKERKSIVNHPAQGNRSF